MDDFTWYNETMGTDMEPVIKTVTEFITQDSLNCDQIQAPLSPTAGESSSSQSSSLPIIVEQVSHGKKGRIRYSELQEMLKLAYDCVARASNPAAKSLDTEEWQQLRKEKDHSDKKDVYRKMLAREDGIEDGWVDEDFSSKYAFLLDEKAEKFLDVMPNLAEKLLEAAKLILKARNSNEGNMKELAKHFNHLVTLFHTEHVNLEQRVNILAEETKEAEAGIRNTADFLTECVDSIFDAELDDIPGCKAVAWKLSNIVNSNSVEVTSKAVQRNSMKMGKLEAQDRFYKMLNLTSLYAETIKSKQEELSQDYENLKQDYVRAREALKRNGIPFRRNNAASSTEGFRKDQRTLWDEGELAETEADRYDDCESETEKVLRHLLGPKTNKFVPPGKMDILTRRTKDNIIFCFLRGCAEFCRCEFYWPWSGPQTIFWLKHYIPLILICTAMLVYIHSFIWKLVGDW